jgi:D-alanyl-D-alanine carboxypeptidase
MRGQVVIALIFFAILLWPRSPAELSFLVAEPLTAPAPPPPQQNVGPTPAPKKIELDVEAKALYIFDASRHEVLYQKNADKALPLASLTKLMTAVVVSEKVPDGSMIPISEFSVEQAGSEGLEAHQKFSKENLLDLMLAASSNDAAWAAAEFYKSDIEEFSHEMNLRAREIGFNSFSFSNPHGLDLISQEGRVASASGSAREIAHFTKWIQENRPGLLDRTKVAEFSIWSEDGDEIKVKNTNEIIGKIPDLKASKTGYTMVAGGNLVFIFEVGGHTILAALLGSIEEGRFRDAEKIVEQVIILFDN